MPTSRVAVSLLVALLGVLMTWSLSGGALATKLHGGTDDAQLSAQAASRYAEAVSLAQHCHYYRALRALSDVTTAEPDFAPAYHLRGDIYHRLFHYEDSIEQYSQAIKLDPNNCLFLADRGIAYMGPDRYVEARRDFDKALALEKNCSRALSGQGIDLRDHNRYQTAIQKQKRALALTPGEWLPHTELAYCYRQIKRSGEALKECDKAIALAPDEAHIHYCKAFAYRDNNQLDQMCAEFDIATERDSEVAEYFFDYARELTGMEQNTRAHEQILKAVSLEPDNAQYRLWKAAIANDLGRFSEAAVDASVAIALKKDDYDNYRQRSRAYLGMKRNAESLADAEMAVKLAPKELNSLFQRSFVLFMSSKYEDCVKSCNQALKLFPKDANQYIYRSFSYFRLGKPALSLADSDRAIKCRDKAAPSSLDYERQAAALVLLHRYDEAEAAENKAAGIRRAAKTEGSPGKSALTKQQSWAVAGAGVLSLVNHEESDTLAGVTITPLERFEKAQKLSQGFGVNNASELRAEIGRLRFASEHAQFAALGNFVAGLTEGEYSKYLESISDQPRLLHKVRIVREYYAELGEKGILGWDLARAINLCRFAYVAGLIDEKTAWSYIMPICRDLQEHFRNFEEVGRNYIIGRKFWDDTETSDTGLDFDVALGELTHFKNSAYRRQPWDVRFEDQSSSLPGVPSSLPAVPEAGALANAKAFVDLVGKNPKAWADILRSISNSQISKASYLPLAGDLPLALQKIMLGLDPSASWLGGPGPHIYGVPQNIVAGPRVVGAYPFNSGVLLASSPRTYGADSKSISLMFADTTKMKITPVKVAGVDQLSDLVVVSDRAYIAGSQKDAPLVAELTPSGIKALPLPPGSGAIHLGVGNCTVLSIRGLEISQLEGGAWHQLALTPVPIKVSAKVVPIVFHGRLYFVEDGDSSDLAWIDIKTPAVIYRLADSLLLAQRKSFNWKEIYDGQISNDQLWISLGNPGQTAVLLNIDKAGDFRIARYRGQSVIDPSNLVEAPHSGPLCIAPGVYQDLYFSEGGWLYRIKSNKLQSLPTLLIDEKGARTSDWPLTKILSLDGGALFVASKKGGALLLQANDGAYMAVAFSEQTKPLTW